MSLHGTLVCSRGQDGTGKKENLVRGFGIGQDK